jgi:hypothetical protein
VHTFRTQANGQCDDESDSRGEERELQREIGRPFDQPFSFGGDGMFFLRRATQQNWCISPASSYKSYAEESPMSNTL